MVTKKNLNVEMHLGRAHSTDRDYFYLEIKDQASHLMLMDIKIPTTLIADFFSNRNVGWDEIKIPAELWQNENFGKTREMLEVVLILEDSAVESLQKEITKWLIKNTKKGWTIHGSDTSWNSKRYDYKTKQYTIQAFRFVEKAEASEEAPAVRT
jgi:hypothetical protein